MPISRRSMLNAAGLFAVPGAVGLLGHQAFAQGAPAPTGAQAEDQHRTPRYIGDANAKASVTEFFSLTCTHCAAFARDTMPRIEKELITPGKLRYAFRDYPLDQVALTAAMVARYLPPNQYYPFCSALFATQDRWAFARNVDSNQEIWKMAALAGMSRATFDQAVADTGLRDWILQQQQADRDHWKIDATPSFLIEGQKYSGEMSFEAFRKLIPEA